MHSTRKLRSFSTTHTRWKKSASPLNTPKNSIYWLPRNRSAPILRPLNIFIGSGSIMRESLVRRAKKGGASVVARSSARARITHFRRTPVYFVRCSACARCTESHCHWCCCCSTFPPRFCLFAAQLLDRAPSSRRKNTKIALSYTSRAWITRERHDQRTV